MGTPIGKIGPCCCADIGECSLLRVSAALRWAGWTAFNLNPASDVVTVRYRNVVVTDVLQVVGDYEAFIFTRPPTQEEIDAGYYEIPDRVGMSSWTSSATEYPMFNDEFGVGINWIYGHFEVEREITGRLWGDTATTAWRPIGPSSYCYLSNGDGYADTIWPTEGLQTGFGCSPFVPPQFVRMDAHCVAPFYELLSTQLTGCDCPSDCEGTVTDWLAVDGSGFLTMGVGCPAGTPTYPNPWELDGAGSGNWKTNLSKVAYDTLFAGLAAGTPDVGYPQVSEDGLTMVCRWTGSSPADVLTRTWVLSEPWTLEEAEAACRALLLKVPLVAGGEFYACDGSTITLGCGEGETDRVGVTEDPVCVDGTVVQEFTVGPESDAWGATLGDEFLSARTRVPAAGPGCGAYIILTKSVADLGAGDICEVEHTWTDDVSEATEGAPDCAAVLAGVLTSSPPSTWWGHTYWQA
jgi:hypothetical protein